ncbi:hypothetical protein CPLU01_05263 [Colletotrichum plurivorum]|uniref:Uncharacterized protein n=1 Tax=Colletotrichum plurivorum TaxID=2175906 RepID=A0A8H6KMH3_9PEZI|nr:hypothetical protein CPLU01_05263 [Colletotrichum plurivorum]
MTHSRRRNPNIQMSSAALPTGGFVALQPDGALKMDASHRQGTDSAPLYSDVKTTNQTALPGGLLALHLSAEAAMPAAYDDALQRLSYHKQNLIYVVTCLFAEKSCAAAASEPTDERPLKLVAFDVDPAASPVLPIGSARRLPQRHWRPVPKLDGEKASRKAC